MANPKRRHSNTRTRLRRSQDFLKVKSSSRCPHCGASILPHRICDACGYYRGKQILTVEVKTEKEGE
jgi:large subunit ribosomal protein L32